MLLGGSSLATDYVFYVPVAMSVAGEASEIYAPATFRAHEGLGGAALADACRKEMGVSLPKLTGVYDLKVQGLRVEVSLARGQARDAETSDRLLGALFHTLRAGGFKQVKFEGTVLTGGSFSRGAALVVLPMAEALPPQRLAHGFVRVGARVVAADDFYTRLGVGDQQIRDAYRADLSTAPGSVKLRLLAAIGELRIKDKTPTLLPLLKDADPAVRMAVVKRFKATRDPKVVTHLEQLVKRDDDNEIKIEAVKILVRAGKKQYSKYLLLEKLRSPDAAVIVASAKALIEVNDIKLATAFEALVKHNSPQVRAAGVAGMAHFSLYTEMTSLLNDAQVNRDVTAAVGMILAEKATGTAQAKGISFLLVQGEGKAAVKAAGIAASKRAAGVVKALGQALTRSEPEVRAASAKALGRMKDVAGLEALAVAVRSTSQDVERALFVKEAISIIAVQPLSQVIAISKSPDVTIKELAIKSLSEFSKDRPNPQAIAELKRFLSDGEIRIRRAAVYALARIEQPQILEELIKLKGDSDEAIRAQVVFALSGSEHAQANGLILGFLDDARNTVKLAAIKAIHQRGLKQALHKLKNLVEYRDTAVRYEVLVAITKLTPDAELNLFELYHGRLADRDANIKVLAIDELAKFVKDQRTALAIGAAVTDMDPRVKLHAIKVLSQSADPNAPEQVIRGLFSRDKSVRLAALDALEMLKSDTAIKPISEIMKNESDPEVRKRAEEVISTL